MFTVSKVLGVVHVILSDAITPLQIKDCELLEWLKHEIEELSYIDKTLFSSRRRIFMSKNTLQKIPADCNNLTSLLYNLDANGEIGRAIHIADRNLYDIKHPNWRKDKPKTVVYNYMAADNFRTFEVYPPQVGDKTTSVMALFNTSPAFNLQEKSEIHLSDVYLKALAYSVASDYLMKDTADVENTNLGLKYKTIAQQSLQATKVARGG